MRARPRAGVSCHKKKGKVRDMECIALDCHKKYTYAVVEDEKGRVKWEGEIVYESELWQPFSTKLAPQEVQ